MMFSNDLFNKIGNNNNNLNSFNFIKVKLFFLNLVKFDINGMKIMNKRDISIR